MGVVVGVLRPGRTDGEGDLAGLELERGERGERERRERYERKEKIDSLYVAAVMSNKAHLCIGLRLLDSNSLHWSSCYERQ